VVIGNEAYISAGGLLECRAKWCIIAWNEARKDGGAAVSSTLDHCTIYGNRLSSPGGTQVGGVTGCTVTNSIVWNNTPLNCDPTTIASYSDIQGGWPGIGIIDADPLLWDPDGHDFHLLQVSPCIDTGNPAHAPDPDGSRTDMGALWFDASNCLEPFVFCTAKTNSQGCDARIGSEGTCVAGSDGFYITAVDVVDHSTGLLLWGLNRTAVPFQGGTLCVATTNRLSPQNSTGSFPPPSCTGTFSTHISADFMAKNALNAGTAVYAQYWYRDVAHPDGTGVGLTDALGFMICAP